MAASWKGSISFGLVYIPINLYTAAGESSVSFNQLHKKCGSRIQYKKICPVCNEEVGPGDLIKGYQYEKGKYVTFTDEDLEKIKTEKDKSITISQFVDLQEIDPVYYEKAYYVVPDGGEKAFQLLLRAMSETNKVGIAKVVLGSKETLVALRAAGGNMLLNTLFFQDEIKPIQLQFAPAEQNPAEVELAKQLIGSMVSKFEPQAYHDAYKEKLKTAIAQKVGGQEITVPEEKPSNVINLMDALQESLKRTQAGRKTS